MTNPDIAGLCEELRESANAICDDPPFHDREGDPVPPVVDPDKLFDAADTLERQAAEIERLRGALQSLIDNLAEGDFISETRIDAARAALTGEPQ
jgi:hypothetical protein